MWLSGSQYPELMITNKRGWAVTSGQLTSEQIHYRFTGFWRSEVKLELTPEIVANGCRGQRHFCYFRCMLLGWPTCVNLFCVSLGDQCFLWAWLSLSQTLPGNVGHMHWENKPSEKVPSPNAEQQNLARRKRNANIKFGFCPIAVTMFLPIIPRPTLPCSLELFYIWVCT